MNGSPKTRIVMFIANSAQKAKNCATCNIEFDVDAANIMLVYGGLSIKSNPNNHYFLTHDR